MADPKFQRGFRPLVKEPFSELSARSSGVVANYLQGLRQAPLERATAIPSSPGLATPSMQQSYPTLSERLYYGEPAAQGIRRQPEVPRQAAPVTQEVASPVSAGLQPMTSQTTAPPVSAGLRPAVATTEVIRGEQPAKRYDFALGEGGFAKRTPTGGQFNFATEAELKNIPRGKVAWIDENTYVDENGTYNRIEGGRIYQGGKTWQAEQTPAGVVFRDLRTGAVFGSALEAERGNAIDILEGGAKADALRAEANLRGVQASVLPMEAASQAGLRSAQGGYYRNLGEAALMNQTPAAGLKDMLYDVSSVQTDAAGMPVTVKQTYMQTPQGLRPVINQGNNALIQEAEQAIANGADPEKVRRRLRELLAE